MWDRTGSHWSGVGRNSPGDDARGFVQLTVDHLDVEGTASCRTHARYCYVNVVSLSVPLSVTSRYRGHVDLLIW